MTRFKKTISFASAKKSQTCQCEKGEYGIIDTITKMLAPHYPVLSVAFNLGSCLRTSTIFTAGHLQPKMCITDPDTPMTASL